MVHHSITVWFELDGEFGVAKARVEKMGVDTAWVVVVAAVMTACVGIRAKADMVAWEG